MSVKSKLGWLHSAVYIAGLLFVLTVVENCSNKDGTGWVLNSAKTVLKTTEEAGQGKGPDIGTFTFDGQPD